MSQGLLLVAAPEPRSELCCMRKDCMLIFDTVEEKINHAITVHLPISKSYYKNLEDAQEHHIQRWNKFVLPARPSRRWNVTQQEMTNRKEGRCHCGKIKSEWDSKYRRIYCSDTCSNDWFNKTIFWNYYRDKILYEHASRLGDYKYNQTCDHCGKITNEVKDHWDVDHIIAIMNGGHPWDKRNLQVLCEECHKKKTKQDHEDRREKELEQSYMIIDHDIEYSNAMISGQSVLF